MKPWEKARPDQRYASVPREGVDYASEAYGFVKANQVIYRVATMCRVLDGLTQWLLRLAGP